MGMGMGLGWRWKIDRLGTSRLGLEYKIPSALSVVVLRPHGNVG